MNRSFYHKGMNDEKDLRLLAVMLDITTLVPEAGIKGMHK